MLTCFCVYSPMEEELQGEGSDFPSLEFHPSEHRNLQHPPAPPIHQTRGSPIRTSTSTTATARNGQGYTTNNSNSSGYNGKPVRTPTKQRAPNATAASTVNAQTNARGHSSGNGNGTGGGYAQNLTLEEGNFPTLASSAVEHRGKGDYNELIQHTCLSLVISVLCNLPHSYLSCKICSATQVRSRARTCNLSERSVIWHV